MTGLPFKNRLLEKNLHAVLSEGNLFNVFDVGKRKSPTCRHQMWKLQAWASCVVPLHPVYSCQPLFHHWARQDAWSRTNAANYMWCGLCHPDTSCWGLMLHAVNQGCEDEGRSWKWQSLLQLELLCCTSSSHLPGWHMSHKTQSHRNTHVNGSSSQTFNLPVTP